jgi:hypothetical protein
MSDELFTDVYRRRQPRVDEAAQRRFRDEAFTYWALKDVGIAPRGRIIGADYELGGPYYGGRPQWLQTYEDFRRRAAEDAAWGGYGARWPSSTVGSAWLGAGSLYGDPRSRLYMGPGAHAPGWVPIYSDPYGTIARAQAHRDRIAATRFPSYVYRGAGQDWHITQWADGRVSRVALAYRGSPEPSGPPANLAGDQTIQIVDDPNKPSYEWIKGTWHDIRFADGVMLDTRILAGRLTTSVSDGGTELFRCTKKPNGKVSEVSWTQGGQRYSLALDNGWQTCCGDRQEMRPIRGAGLHGWKIEDLDSRGRLHCTNGKPGEHLLIGRNMKQGIKLNQLEYDDYVKTGKLPDRWENLDLLTPRRVRPAAP